MKATTRKTQGIQGKTFGSPISVTSKGKDIINSSIQENESKDQVKN